MSLTSAEIIAAAEAALARANASMCYLHRSGNEAAFAVVIDAEHLGKLGDLIPESDAASALFMDHGHLEADDPWPEEPANAR